MMRLPLKEAGAEPDEAWCFNEEKNNSPIL